MPQRAVVLPEKRAVLPYRVGDPVSDTALTDLPRKPRKAHLACVSTTRCVNEEDWYYATATVPQ